MAHAAWFRLFIVVAAVCMVPHVLGSATFVHFTVTSPQNLAGSYGCMPTTYSGDNTAAITQPVEIVLAQPRNGCRFLDGDVTGKIVLVNSESCASVYV